MVTRVVRGALCATPNLPSTGLAASANPDLPAFFKNRRLETVFMGRTSFLSSNRAEKP